jgi:hypothetical protein
MFRRRSAPEPAVSSAKEQAPGRQPDIDPLPLEIVRRLQLVTPYDQRERAARHIAAAVTAMLAARSIECYGAPDPKATELLLTEGCLELGAVLSDRQVAQVLDHLAERAVVACHTPLADGVGLTGRPATSAVEFPHISYPFDDVMHAPHLLELANSERMLGLAQHYLGCVPTLYSLNVMIAHPTDSPTPYLQAFHRDNDDFRFVTLFVFLSDVLRDEDGAHVFVRRSHSLEQTEQRLALHPDFASATTLAAPAPVHGMLGFYGNPGSEVDTLARKYLAEWTISIRGRRGTGFLVDTGGLHRGTPPRTGQRIMFWARYGLYSNLCYATMRTAPAPWAIAEGRISGDARSRYVNRLLLA